MYIRYSQQSLRGLLLLHPFTNPNEQFHFAFRFRLDLAIEIKDSESKSMLMSMSNMGAVYEIGYV